MRAVTTRGDGIASLKLGERPTPAFGPTDTLVAMRAAALNYRDLLVVNGRSHWKPPVPRIPLSDGVGVVTAVGRRASRWRVGDRVAGIFLPNWVDGALTPEKSSGALGGSAVDGVLAGYRVFSEQSLVRVPDQLTDVEAATLPVAAVTAWNAVNRRSRIKSGDSVLIQGTGGVSLFALQFAHALGARPIVLSSSDEKLEKVRAMGAAITVNYRRNPSWAAEVVAATDGLGVDHVIEVVGGENLNHSLDAVRLGGTISFIGLIGGMAAQIDTWQFVAKDVRIHGIETGSREMFEEMNDFIVQHRLRPAVDRVFAFDEAREALLHLESGAQFGKIAVAFNGAEERG
jgi:NADPH:quinone reductase-like Zn-dependent oxidoreductase